MRCGLARCLGAKFTRFSIIPVVSFSHVHAISSRLQCNTAGYPLCHHNTLDIKENNQHVLELRKTHAYFLVLEMMLTSTASTVAWFPDLLKYPSFITSNYRIQQIWFILNALRKVQTQFLAMFSLFI